MHLSRTASYALVFGPLVLFGTAPAQSFVSPVGLANVEGSSNSPYPFMDTTPRRRMQIHSDLKGSAVTIGKLALRKDGSVATGTGTRSLSIEIWMAASVDWDKASFLFDLNYLNKASATRVLPRQTVNLGPLTGTGSPSPFEIAFVFATPFAYTGTTSLLWEALVYSNTVTGTFAAAADLDFVSSLSPNAPTTGSGCTVTGQPFPMSLWVFGADSCGTYHFGAQIENAPANSTTVLAFGSANPNQQVPGLCSTLLTNLLATPMVGKTDATGFLGATWTQGTVVGKNPGGSLVFLAPNIFAGAALYLQAHTIDPTSSSPIQVANSEGRKLVVPQPNLTRINKVTSIDNHDGGTTGVGAIYNQFGNVGGGLVTQFN